MTGIDEHHRASEPSCSVERGADPAGEARAAAYGLLATLLAGPPPAHVLHELATLPATVNGSSVVGPLAQAWAGLGAAARAAEARRVAAEYHALFIGLTQGELVPYASWYRSGALMDRPLVRLRHDLAGLGFAREAGVHEPEDHAATLCAVMQSLLATADEDAAGHFFHQHLEPWLMQLFTDMARAPSADFYTAVAALGARLTDLESTYWSLPGEGHDDDARRLSAANRQARTET
jgi:TorA maturation chaperone TorD